MGPRTNGFRVLDKWVPAQMGLGQMGPKLRTRIILSAAIKFLLSDCQAKTIGFRVPTVTSGHLHC